jgi:hypothetical protein
LPNPFNEGDRWNEQVWERWCDSDKLGWTKEMGEYFTRNLKRCNVWNTLSKRKGPSRLRRWASEGVQKGDGTFDSGGLTLLDSLYYKILVLPVSDAIAKPQ